MLFVGMSELLSFHKLHNGGIVTLSWFLPSWQFHLGRKQQWSKYVVCSYCNTREVHLIWISLYSQMWCTPYDMIGNEFNQTTASTPAVHAWITKQRPADVLYVCICSQPRLWCIYWYTPTYMQEHQCLNVYTDSMYRSKVFENVYGRWVE